MKASLKVDIENILTRYRTIAIVGASADPERPSHRVATYLKERGYRIIPVTPKGGEILGEKVYPDLSSIPERVEVVDVFRRPEDVMSIAEQAIAVGAKALWLQEGVVNEEAAARAREAGLTVVMDHCMKKEHMRHITREKGNQGRN
jgi:predicted CoA-binding protein